MHTTTSIARPSYAFASPVFLSALSNHFSSRAHVLLRLRASLGLAALGGAGVCFTGTAPAAFVEEALHERAR
eukprot:9710462-Alexandrium_andersonii.AAC.1